MSANDAMEDWLVLGDLANLARAALFSGVLIAGVSDTEPASFSVTLPTSELSLSEECLVDL